MDNPLQAMPDIEVLPAHFPIPGAGFLPVNAFIIKAKEPVLVDAGMGIESEEFMKALESIIDPHDLKWVWLTHDDADHIGNIQKVLEAAPTSCWRCLQRFLLQPLSLLPIRRYWSRYWLICKTDSY
jgi:glyoxylase-like metal-dependent hydrolase (beta-lactamase superfamily II)